MVDRAYPTLDAFVEAEVAPRVLGEPAGGMRALVSDLVADGLVLVRPGAVSWVPFHSPEVRDTWVNMILAEHLLPWDWAPMGA